MIIHLLLVIPAVFSAARNCDPPTPKYFVCLRYDQYRDENLQYPNGTTVYASCRDGTTIREGAERSTCIDGQWVPELGRCPYHCSMKEFTEKRGYSNADKYKPEPYPKVDVENNWRKDGTGAYACCLRSTVWGSVIADWHYYTCKDGGWHSYYPNKYNKCR